MAVYVMSDIHGQYDMFDELLKKIKLKPNDTLYVLGDIIDRGKHPVSVLTRLMDMPNAICIVGNHELMALECLTFLMKEITDESLEAFDDKMLANILTWQYNGGNTTLNEFNMLDTESQRALIEFMKDFSVYEEVNAGGRDYLLVHAGLGNFSKDKEIEDYSLYELVWKRADYNVQYFEDKYVISGHTPTQTIEGNPRPGYIFRQNNHIAIDCGAHFNGGRLAAVCLDTGEEFYSSTNSEAD